VEQIAVIYFILCVKKETLEFVVIDKNSKNDKISNGKNLDEQ